MKEIKLRAYDREHKCWQYLTIGDLLDSDQISETRFKNWSRFTGLKDINGKEIYEGDIVRGSWIQTDSNGYETCHDFINSPVCYNSEYAAFMLNGNGKFPLENYLNFLYQIVPSEIKVIGNIHQNPELLEQEK